MKKLFFLAFLLVLGFYLFDKYKPLSVVSNFSKHGKNTGVRFLKNDAKNAAKNTSPKTDKDFLAKAKSEIKNKDYKSAISSYTKAIELNPDCAEAFQGRGLAKDKITDFAGAKRDYDRAIAILSGINKKRTQAAYEALRALVEKGDREVSAKDYKNAIADYTLAADTYPQYPDAYISRGDLRHMLKDYNGALSDYNKALRMSSGFELYYKRGNVKYDLKDYKNAVEDYKTAVGFDGKREQIYYKLSGALIHCERFEEAAENLRKFTENSEKPYIYAADFHSWNDILNKYHNDSIIRDIKNSIKKFKVI